MDNVVLGVCLIIVLYVMACYMDDTNYMIMANICILATIVEAVKQYGPKYRYKEEPDGVETI
jgi:hypothetical protein